MQANTIESRPVTFGKKTADNIISFNIDNTPCNIRKFFSASYKH